MLKDGLDIIMNSQNDTFQLMANMGWYPINNVSKRKINDVYIKIKNQN